MGLSHDLRERDLKQAIVQLRIAYQSHLDGLAALIPAGPQRDSYAERICQHAEEFGPRHTVKSMMTEPNRFGFPATWRFNEPALLHQLTELVTSADDLDMTATELRRLPLANPAPYLLHIHGTPHVVDWKANTLTASEEPGKAEPLMIKAVEPWSEPSTKIRQEISMRDDVPTRKRRKSRDR